MTIQIKETGKEYELTLKVWSERDQQWSPDCFGDLETNVPRVYPRVDGDCAYIMPESDFTDLCEWWGDECQSANADPDYQGDGLYGAQPGTEYCFTVEELTERHN